MSWVDLAIVALFLLYAISNGLRSRKISSKNLNEYFLAGRTLSAWKAGVSMAATQFAADTPLLVTGLIASGGIFALWQLWIYAIAFLLLGFLLSGAWRRAGVLTDAELTEIRYSGNAALLLRGIKAVYFGTIFNCIVLAWVLFAAARIAEPFLPWNEWLPESFFNQIVELVRYVNVPISLHAATSDGDLWVKTANDLISILILISVTAFYSTAGGLRSVVATDIAQFVIMMVATLAYAFVLLDQAGGLNELQIKLNAMFSDGQTFGISFRELTSFTPDGAKNAGFAVLTLFAMQWLIQINSDGTGYLAQRSMACHSDDAAKKAAVIFAFLQILLRSLLWLIIGLALLVAYPPSQSPMLQSTREVTYVQGIAELLPIGIKGLMVTAMFAAFSSTLDTHLNWGASYWTNDLFKRLICEKWLKREASDKMLVMVARLSNIVLVLLSLLIATQLNSINEAWQTSLLFGAGLGPILLMRWLWWRVTAVSELAAILASLLLAPLLYFQVADPATRLLLAALGSTSAALIAIMFGPKESPDTLKVFYVKVNPPGFWRGIGENSIRDVSSAEIKLRRALVATFSAALSLFCWLIAAGSYLAGSPAPVWFPFPPELWLVLLLVAGCISGLFWVPDLIERRSSDN